MPTRIGILHFAVPPAVGGVEATILYHARGLADLGHTVRVIGGAGAPFDPRIETHIDPLFGSKHPDVLHVKAQLDGGEITSAFHDLTQRITAALKQALEGCDVCIAHNIHTLHKNIPLTVALHTLTRESAIRMVAWCHDLAWTNPQYESELRDSYPWDLLKQEWPRTTYVTVSEPRRHETSTLLGIPPEHVRVIVPGVDVARFLKWTPTTQHIVQSLRLMDADGILLLPARLTRRKNIGLALRVLAELRADGRDWRLVVSGPPGPHNPTNRGYLGELLDQRAALGLEHAAHFLYALGESDETPLVPDDDTMANLYQLADALFFPSTQEGFGIPVLEAGLVGLPIFCADIAPFHKTAGRNALYFDPVNDRPHAIAEQVRGVLDNSSVARMRVRVRHQYRWERIIAEHIEPLIK